MARYVLILIGGLIGISVLALMLTHSSSVRRLEPALTTSTTDKTAPEGLFIPNFGRDPVDAYLFLRRSRSVLLLKARSIELRAGNPVDGNLQFRLQFIGINQSPKVEASRPDPQHEGFTTVQYNRLFDGVDLQLIEQAGIIEATFILERAEDAGQVVFKLDSAKSNRMREPSAYQIIDGQRVPVAASFEPARFGAMQLKLGKAAPAAAVHVDVEIVL